MESQFHQLLGMKLDDAAETPLMRSLNDPGEIMQFGERTHLLPRRQDDHNRPEAAAAEKTESFDSQGVISSHRFRATRAESHPTK